MGGEMIRERLLILRQPEEIVLFANPVRRQRRMERALAVEEVLFLLELFAAVLFAAVVHPLVDIAELVDAARDLSDAGAVARLRCADEVVERNIKAFPRLAELLLHPVAVHERIEPFFDRLLEHVLRMFVIAHQKARVEAAQPLVAGDDVGTYLLVRRAEMRTAVDVIDGSCQIKAVHVRPSTAPYAATAMACTSRTGKLFAAASCTQSSNSGVAVMTRPLRDETLKRTAPSGVVTVTISRARHSRSTS